MTSIYVVYFLQTNPDLTEKLLLVVIPSIISGFGGFWMAWKKLKSETKKTEVDAHLAIIKNQDYWMNKCQIGLKEALRIEEENSEYKLFNRHAMKFFLKLRKVLDPVQYHGLIEDLNELELESDSITRKLQNNLQN